MKRVKGLQAYYLHLFIIALLGIAYVTTYSDEAITSLLSIILFVYAMLYILGLYFGIGPLKYINNEIVKDHESDLDNYKRPKQPWE